MSEQIKILFVIPNLNIEGAQCMLVSLICNMHSDRFKPCVVVLNTTKATRLTKRLNEMGVEIFFMKKIGSSFAQKKFQQLRHLARITKIVQPDIIHAHLDYYATWVYALLSGRKIIETIHSQPYRIKNKWTVNIYPLLEKRKLIRPIFLTESGSHEFMQVFHSKNEKMDIIPNPIETNLYRCDKREKDKDKDNIRFTCIGRFHPVKNHKLLIDAFGEVVDKFPTAKLQLAGVGELLEREKEHVKDLGIEKNVLFLGEVENVASLLAQTDVFVVSSNSESFSLVMLEAMASGLPIITTAVGGIRDIFVDNGIMVEAENKEELRDAMFTMALDEELRARCGKKSFELSQNYDVSKIVALYEQVYFEEVCDEDK